MWRGNKKQKSEWLDEFHRTRVKLRTLWCERQMCMMNETCRIHLVGHIRCEDGDELRYRWKTYKNEKTARHRNDGFLEITPEFQGHTHVNVGANDAQSQDESRTGADVWKDAGMNEGEVKNKHKTCVCMYFHGWHLVTWDYRICLRCSIDAPHNGVFGSGPITKIGQGLVEITQKNTRWMKKNRRALSWHLSR